MNQLNLNQQQIKSLLDGGEYLVFPLGEGSDVYTHNLKQLKYKECEYNKEFYEHLRQVYVRKYSPIQPNKSYYVVEDFMNVWNIDKEEIMYKNDFTSDKLQDGLPVAHNDGEKIARWLDADQMQPHQSRLHIKCVSVEVKKVEDMWGIEVTNLKKDIDYSEGARESLKKEFNITTDYILLAKVERIKT